MKTLRMKSILLTDYLEYLLKEIDPFENSFSIITPTRSSERGCQLSIFLKKNGKKVFNALTRNGVSLDWREPNVIRLAPVPLYNTFEEVFRFAEIFKNILAKKVVRPLRVVRRLL